MKFRCCKNAISSIMITNCTISFCPQMGKRKYAFENNYKGETNIINKYINEREIFINNCKDNKNIPEQCLNCQYFIDAEWDTTLGITYIGIANRQKCSCNCIYCAVSDGSSTTRKELNSLKVWDIRPLLNELRNSNIIADKGKMIIAGGECSEYPASELRWLINFSKNINFDIKFASSGMFYSKEIEYALKTIKSNLIISPDSGTREIYEKIKRVKYYDKVWKNIKKYIKCSKNNIDASIVLKYILLENTNDNINEFKAFINKCNEVECQNICVSIDIEWLKIARKQKQKFPDNLIQIFEYIEHLNDNRIYFDFFNTITRNQTSAVKYSKNIETTLKLGYNVLEIFLFAGNEHTYKKLTNSNVFNIIWENIKQYSEHIQKDFNTYSFIQIKYKLIPYVNDSIEELNELINRCHSLNIKNIEIGLMNNENRNFDNQYIDRLKYINNYLKNNSSISYSSNIIKLIDKNNKYVLGNKK